MAAERVAATPAAAGHGGADARAAGLLEYLTRRRQAMVDLLVELASLESPSDVPESQRPVQQRLSEALEERGYVARILPGRRTGGVLWARPRDRRRGAAAQLLLGHSDTVWPLGTLHTMPVRVDDARVHGPGTFDMKAGLVQGIFALEAIRGLGLEAPAVPVFLVNADEEIGSPESKRWVRRAARRSARAFVLEPAMGSEGRLKTARKGIANFRVVIQGRAAHAGLEPTKGASAIAELAHVIERLHAMTDLARGITVNVGTVRGGSRPNVVAAEAVAEVDVRVMTLADGEEITRRIRSLEARIPGTSLRIDGGLGIPPMERSERNQELWHQAKEAAGRLGIHLDESLSGGASDGNTTSQLTATLDGLGPIGDGAHAVHEHVSIDGMVERAALLAELLLAPVGADS